MQLLGGDQKLAITKAMAELEEGTKAIAVRQKYIKIADHFMAVYENDELEENLDNEKRLFKAKGSEKRQKKK